MTDGAPTFEAGAIILAGGESRRMGQNKGLLPYHGAPLIQHVARQLQPHFREVLISANTPETYAFLQLPVITDAIPGRGPLGGIATALGAAHYDWNLVVATDIPQFPLSLMERLYARTPGQTAVVPVDENGRFEPLFAFYHRAILPELQACIAAGQLRLQDVLAAAGALAYPVEAGQLDNLNTPEQYRRAIELPPAE